MKVLPWAAGVRAAALGLPRRIMDVGQIVRMAPSELPRRLMNVGNQPRGGVNVNDAPQDAVLQDAHPVSGDLVEREESVTKEYAAVSMAATPLAAGG